MLSGQRVSCLLVVCGAMLAVSCGNGSPTRPASVTPVSLWAAAGTTRCEPAKSAGGVVTPCTVPFRAAGRGFTSLAWSGCCAGSTGETGSCSVNALAAFSCTVTATGPNGTTSASATATGVDAGPLLDPRVCCTSNGSRACLPLLPTGASISCDEGYRVAASKDLLTCSVQASGACQNAVCDVAGGFSLQTSAAGGVCSVQETATDSWGKQATQSWRFPVKAMSAQPE